MEGKMTVSCESVGTCLMKEEYPVTLLPYDFWEGVNESPELLASFVVPNHPAIRPILQRASEILGAWTGSPALDGYQSGDPNRSKLMMAAVYDAIAGEGLTYANPPASFAEQGQRVRLPEDILSVRLAHLPGRCPSICRLPGSGGIETAPGGPRRTRVCRRLACGKIFPLSRER
jgi:hypothetical protein